MVCLFRIFQRFLFLRNHHRSPDADEQYEDDEHQRTDCINLEEIVDEHLHTDEHQQHTHTHFQIAELVGYRCQQEEEGNAVPGWRRYLRRTPRTGSQPGQENTAGMLSKAKIRSQNSMNTTVITSGPRCRRFCMNFTTGCSRALISSFLFLLRNILAPL